MDLFQKSWLKSSNVNYDKWKIISLCILAATTFWFFSALNKSDYTTTINYPIELVYPGQDTLVVIGELPRSLRMNVTGGGWNLFRRSFGMGTIPLLVTVNNPTDTRYLLGSSLEPHINDQITTFSLNSVITDTIHFHIEKEARRWIKLTIEGINPGENHIVLGDILVEPDTISVSGPLTYVNNLMEPMLLKISEVNITEDYQEVIDIEFAHEQIWSIPNQVLVSFKVDQLTNLEHLAPVTTRNFTNGYTIDMESLSYLVQYTIASSYQDSIGENSIQVYADFAEMGSDSTIRLKAHTDNQYILKLDFDSVSVPVVKER